MIDDWSRPRSSAAHRSAFGLLHRNDRLLRVAQQNVERLHPGRLHPW
jgi:hypothetical protein